MIINKTKCMVYAVLLVAVGYVAGAYIGVPFVERELLSGDIGKARLYKNSNDSGVDVCAEQMLADSTYRQQTLMSIFVLGSQVNDADSIVGSTIKATDNVAALKNVNAEVKSIAVKTKNAKTAIKTLLENTERLLSGKTVDGYEQLVNNAGLAVMAVDDAMNLCPEIVGLLTDYGLKNDNQAILASAGQWLQYGAENAVLTGNDAAVKAWQAAYAEGKEKGLDKYLRASYPTLEKSLGKVQSMINANAQSLKQTTRTLGQTTRTLGQTTRTLGQTTRTLGQTTRTLGQTTRTLGQTTRTLGALASLESLSASVGLKQQCLSRLVNTAE